MLPKVSVPVVAVANQKGGVGKTTVTSILAEWMAYVRGKRVLLIDLDMQCNTSEKWVGMDAVPNSLSLKLPPIHPEYEPASGANERSSIADIFWGKSVLPYESWLSESTTKSGFVDVLMGHPELLEDVSVEFAKSSENLKEKVIDQLRKFLASENLSDIYDIVFLDTGPSRTPVFRAAIRAASHIVVPFAPEENDFQGIVTMLQVVRQENYKRGINERLEIAGLLPNKVRQGTMLHRKNLAEILGHHESMLFPAAAWLPISTKIPERDVKGSRPQTVFELRTADSARIAATVMALYFENKVFPDQHLALETDALEIIHTIVKNNKLDWDAALAIVFADKGAQMLAKEILASNKSSVEV